MSYPSREDIMKALFAKLSKASGFKTFSRKIKLPTGGPSDATATIPPGDQPALIMAEGAEKIEERGRGLPPKHFMDVSVIIYAIVAPDVAGATIINPLLDAVEASIRPSGADTTQTLGGLVSHVWPEGDVIKEMGDIDTQGQGFALLPLKILVP